MALRPEEITSVIQRELEGFEQDLKMVDVGTVLEVGDGIARVYGLQGAKVGRIAGVSRRPRSPSCPPWASRSTWKKTTSVW